MTRNRKDRKKEQGFTLIEIVAVLVILGILAAVAVPKYFDLQDSARKNAAAAAVAEVQARVNALFGEQLLAAKTCTEAKAYAIDPTNIDTLGNDWTYTLGTEDDNKIPVTLSFGGEEVDHPDSTKSWEIVTPECATTP